MLGAMSLASLAGCGRSSDAAMMSMKMPPPAVQTVEAKTRDVPIYLDEIGKTVAFNSVTVTPQVSGAVTKILFIDGAELKKGQPLFEIDPRPYVAALDSAKADLAKAQAALEFAQADFARVKDLVPTKAISQEDYDTKKNAMDVDAAQVESAKAEIETAQLNLNYCSITSPIDGIAGQRLVDIGNIVTSSMQMPTTSSMLSIQQVDPIYVQFTITESELARVRQNMRDTGHLTVQVSLPSDTGEGHDGTMDFIDNSVMSGAGTVTLRATLQNADRHFWPGQFVRVRLILKVQKDAVLVPASAIQIGQQGSFVYAVQTGPGPDQQPATLAQIMPVTVGQRQGSDVIIDSGLHGGEQVITEGQLMVMPGGPVAVAPPVSQASGPTAVPVETAVAAAADRAADHTGAGADPTPAASQTQGQDSSTGSKP